MRKAKELLTIKHRNSKRFSKKNNTMQIKTNKRNLSQNE